MSSLTIRELKVSIIEKSDLVEGDDFIDHSNCDSDDCHSRNSVNLLKSGWEKIADNVGVDL